MSDSEETAVPATRWLASPARRNWLASAVAFVPCAVFIVLALLEPGRMPREQAWLLIMIVGICFTLSYAALTVFALRGLEGEVLRRSVVNRRATDFGSTPTARSLAVQITAVVLIVVSVMVVTPALRGETVLVGLALGLVVSSWINMALLFAENYIGSERRGLQFPGEGEPGFADYVYFSLSVQMTFGTTDVTVLDRATRRNVTVHGVTAFAFNSVIIAMIVSLLVGS